MLLEKPAARFGVDKFVMQIGRNIGIVICRAIAEFDYHRSILVSDGLNVAGFDLFHFPNPFWTFGNGRLGIFGPMPFGMIIVRFFRFGCGASGWPPSA